MLVIVLYCASGCVFANRLILTSSDRMETTPADFGIPYCTVSIGDREARLHGWYVAGSRTKPLILLFHGNAGNISDCIEYVKLFHANGFSVCLFDYRGYGASSGESVNEDDFYDDARRVLSYLKSLGWGSREIIYYGQSMGAAVAVQMALESPPGAVVLESPFTSFHDIALFHSPVAYGLVGRFLIHIPFENREKIRNIVSPLLIIHGDEDDVVPLEMSLQLFAGAQTAKKFCLVRGGRHCDGFAGDSAGVTGAITRFAVEAVPVRPDRVARQAGELAEDAWQGETRTRPLRR